MPIGQTVPEIRPFSDFQDGGRPPCLDHPGRVFGGLCHCAKFGWSRCSSFDNKVVLIFCMLSLKMLIHAPMMVFFGGFDPQNKVQY